MGEIGRYGGGEGGAYGGGEGAYGYDPHRDMSKSSGHGTLAQDPVGFAAYSDYPQSYNMADLGNRGTQWNQGAVGHQRTGSEGMAPGVAGVGAGVGAVGVYEDDAQDGAATGLRYRRTQSSGHGVGGGGGRPEAFYDAAAMAGGYYGATRAPDGGYGIARYAQGAGYPDPPGQLQTQMEMQTQTQTQGGYLAPDSALPNPHLPQATQGPQGAQGEERTSAAYGGYEDGDPFAAVSQLSHSQGGHSTSPQPRSQGHSVSPPIPITRSPGSHEAALTTAFGGQPSAEAGEEDGYAGSEAGSVGDEEDYAGGRRILKVCNLFLFYFYFIFYFVESCAWSCRIYHSRWVLRAVS